MFGSLSKSTINNPLCFLCIQNSVEFLYVHFPCCMKYHYACLYFNETWLPMGVLEQLTANQNSCTPQQIFCSWWFNILKFILQLRFLIHVLVQLSPYTKNLIIKILIQKYIRWYISKKMIWLKYPICLLVILLEPYYEFTAHPMDWYLIVSNEHLKWYLWKT